MMEYLFIVLVLAAVGGAAYYIRSRGPKGPGGKGGAVKDGTKEDPK